MRSLGLAVGALYKFCKHTCFTLKPSRGNTKKQWRPAGAGQALSIHRQVARSHLKQVCPSRGRTSVFHWIFQHPTNQMLDDALPRDKAKAEGFLPLLENLLTQHNFGGSVRRNRRGVLLAHLCKKKKTRKLKYKKFQMESIYPVRNLLPPGAFMAMVDLQDAYLHILINGPPQVSKIRDTVSEHLHEYPCKCLLSAPIQPYI